MKPTATQTSRPSPTWAWVSLSSAAWEIHGLWDLKKWVGPVPAPSDNLCQGLSQSCNSILAPNSILLMPSRETHSGCAVEQGTGRGQGTGLREKWSGGQSTSWLLAMPSSEGKATERRSPLKTALHPHGVPPCPTSRPSAPLSPPFRKGENGEEGPGTCLAPSICRLR